MRLIECPSFTVRFLLLAVLSVSFGFLSTACSSQAKLNHIARGEALLQKRTFEEAAMEFRAAIDIDEDSAEARWGLARTYEGLGQILDSIGELRRVIELDPDNLDAHARLGNFLLALDPPQISEAEKLVQIILARDPNFIEGHILAASSLAAQKKSEEEVLAVFNRAISLDPNRTASYVSLARYYVGTDKPAEAEKALKKGISVNPNSAIGYLEYGRFLNGNKRESEAEAQFVKAVETEPKSVEANLSIAQFYAWREQFDKAEHSFKQLTEIEDNSPESRMELANFYAFIDRDDDAIRTFESILADFPQYVRARYRLGETYLDRGDTERTAAQIETLLAINDRDASALMLRARYSLQLNKAAVAVEDLEEILKKNPSQKEALFYITQARLDLGQIEQARAFIGDLERYHPRFLRVNLLKIQASLAAGEAELALQQSNQLLKLLAGATPNAENNAQSLSDLKTKALSARGLSNLQLGEIIEAQNDLKEVVRLKPNSASALVGLARTYIAQSNLTDAQNLYERAIAADNRSFDALSGLVNIFLRSRQFNDAHAKIDQSIEQNNGLNGALPALHYLKSDVFRAEKNFQSAEIELKKAIELDGNYLPAYSAYAVLLIERNQTDAALEQYREVVEKQPAAAVYTLMGMLEDARNNPAEAERHYRRALDLEPDSPIAANNLAWLIASNQGNLDEALRLAETTVSRNPATAGYFDTLGWVCYKKGLFTAAVEHLRKAVALDAAEAAQTGGEPNQEYRQRLAEAINSARGKPSA